MSTTSKKQYNSHIQLCKELDEYRILTSDGKHFICEVHIMTMKPSATCFRH